jgi:hypothetical protein
MTDYSFELELSREDGELIARVPVDPDWTRAHDCLHFAAVRKGRLPALTCAPAAGNLRIAPVWAEQSGAPYIDAVILTLACDDGEVRSMVPRTYFSSLARATSIALDRRADEDLQYRVCATPAPRRPFRQIPTAFEVEEVVQQLSLAPKALDDALESATIADAELDDGDMPLFVPATVFEETRAQAQAAGDIETGGILIGHLYRDTATPEIFAEVTAQIPAAHADSQTTRLTFTADTWAAARAAVALRRRHEHLLAFWHSHADWCRLRGCPRERRLECSGALPFLSAEDVHLFGTCFGRAYHTTLLVSESTARGWTCAMYGWRRGIVARRAFHIIGGAG